MSISAYTAISFVSTITLGTNSTLTSSTGIKDCSYSSISLYFLMASSLASLSRSLCRSSAEESSENSMVPSFNPSPDTGVGGRLSVLLSLSEWYLYFSASCHTASSVWHLTLAELAWISLRRTLWIAYMLSNLAKSSSSRLSLALRY